MRASDNGAVVTLEGNKDTKRSHNASVRRFMSGIIHGQKCSHYLKTNEEKI